MVNFFSVSRAGNVASNVKNGRTIKAMSYDIRMKAGSIDVDARSAMV
jgi:hypothetical protein